MEIVQFEDKNLSHFSYAILSRGEVALIDPSRDPRPYYRFAEQQNAKITSVIETHPHADFVSSHLEIHNTTGAIIYVSKMVKAEYPHTAYDDGNSISLGNITLKAINTPGHSPDSISILAIDESGREKAVFTGDTLFVGDCGRPDLREKPGDISVAKKELARQLFHSLRNKLMNLPDEVLVYPAHGAGSLCGKSMSGEKSSTMGAEKMSNPCLQSKDETTFVEELLKDQPFIPKYFPFNVSLNKKGAEDFKSSISKVEVRPNISKEFLDTLDPDRIIIDSRPQEQFKKSHLNGAINLMDDTKFETWLGSIVNPGEMFYLVGENETVLKELIERSAKIGYEQQIALAFVSDYGTVQMKTFNSDQLSSDPGAFTIVDIRNESEVKEKKIFDNSLNIPLPELRERINEIPTDKPIVVHCAGGYRSAAGSSIVEAQLNKNIPVYDLSTDIKLFQNEVHQKA